MPCFADIFLTGAIDFFREKKNLTFFDFEVGILLLIC